MLRAALLSPLLAWTVAGCAAKHVVPPEPPTVRSELAGFDGLKLQVKSVSFRGVGPEDSAAAQSRVRERLVDYLGAHGRFSEIVDLQTNYSNRGAAHPQPLTLDLEVSIALDHTAYRTYILDIIAAYPFAATFPLVPQWGSATVEVNAVLRDASAQAIWTGRQKGEAPYDIIWYAWFRTEPVEVAYRAATGQAFEKLASDLAAKRPEIVAKLGDRLPAPEQLAVNPQPKPPPPAEVVPPPAETKPPSIQTGAPLALAGARASWIVAVMEITDTNAADEKKAVGGMLLRNLSDQLRIFVAQQGLRVVDRGQQERALREIVQDAKEESYKACFDSSCQIPLGKALAASHLLRSQVTRFGSACVLNGELIDLRREITVAAGSARGDCSEEGFLSASERVTSSLLAASANAKE